MRSPGTGDIFRHYNLCIQESTAEFISILHNDDLIAPSFLKIQLQTLQQNPEIDLALCAGDAIGSDDELLWPLVAPPQIERPILSPTQVLEFIATHGNSFFICPTAIFRRSVFELVGLFDPSLKISADIDMTLRILFSGRKVAYNDQKLMRYRIATTQTSAQWGRAEPSDFFKVIDQWIATHPLNADHQYQFQALRHLDLLHVGLNQLAAEGSPAPLMEEIQWFNQNSNTRSQFGMVDRLKIGAALLSRGAFSGALGPMLARTLLKNTEARRAWWLRKALKMKRKIGRS